MSRILRAWLAALVLASPALAWGADPVATLRTGNHPGFGRVVLDLPATAHASVAEQDGALILTVTGAALHAGGPPPRNLTGVSVQPGRLVLALRPGAHWRQVPVAGKLVIDILDPTGQPPPPPRAAPPPALHPTAQLTTARQPGRMPLATAIAPAAPHAPVPLPAPTQPAPPAPAAIAPPAPPGAPAVPPEVQASIAAPEPAPVQPVETAPPTPPAGPVALAASLSGDAVCLPFAPTTGAAALRQGGEVLLVFDERRPLDLAGLRDHAPFDAARLQQLPAATLLHLPLDPATPLHLARSDACWLLSLGPFHPLPLALAVDSGSLRIAAGAPGQVVVVPDSAGGGQLLVGTQLKPGEAMPIARRMAEFALPATLLGVAVAPTSDGLVLRAAPPGFVLEAPPGRALALDAPDAQTRAATEAALLTRRWDFPALPTEALQRRLQAATDAAATAPPQSRGAARLAAIQAQLALGLDAEAAGLATLTRTEDAHADDTPDAAALGAVANLLAGRWQDAQALDDARLTASDEVALWRAARLAWREDGAPDGAPDAAPEAAAVFAATARLADAYPDPLRRRLLPLLAETMAAGGERAAAQRLLDAHKDDPGLDYARALLDEAQGHAAPSLAVLDRLAQSPDRRLRARAAVRAVEQRLRIGELTRSAAAEALDKLIFAWRGDASDLALRERVADLRAQSGNWRAALAVLRDTADSDIGQSPPATQARLRARMAEVFAQAMAADAVTPISPLDMVALAGDNPDLLPPGEAGRDLAARLASRLAALDLPRRVIPVLERLVVSTAPGPARAEIGARLADLRLDQGNPTEALQVLSQSAAPELPLDLDQRRSILFARATAATGHLPEALATLAAVNSAEALDAAAGLHEAAKAWPQASAALAALAARVLPAAGPLSDGDARLVLQLASAAAQAGDEPVLAQVRERALPRLPDGKIAEMVRLLAAAPVRGVADLPRAAREATLAHSFPGALATLAPAAAAP